MLAVWIAISPPERQQAYASRLISKPQNIFKDAGACLSDTASSSFLDTHKSAMDKTCDSIIVTTEKITAAMAKTSRNGASGRFFNYAKNATELPYSPIAWDML